MFRSDHETFIGGMHFKSQKPIIISSEFNAYIHTVLLRPKFKGQLTLEVKGQNSIDFHEHCFIRKSIIISSELDPYICLDLS